jgi:hypothetical protein
MNPSPVVLSVVLAIGCSSRAIGPGKAGAPRPGTTPLPATQLLGPYPSRDDACNALVRWAAREGKWRSAACSVAFAELGRGAPFGAAVLMVKDAAPADPRLTGAGAYFLGLSMGGAWFLFDKVLDEVNAGAGHTFIPEVSPESASIAERTGGAPHVLIRLRDASDSLCNACEGKERENRTPGQTRMIVTVCARLGSGKPECTPPQMVHIDARTKLEDDTLVVAEPGAKPVTFALSF